MLAYVRRPASERLLVALNLGGRPGRLAPPGVRLAGRVELSTHPDRDGDAVAGELVLRGDEGLVVRLDS